MSRALLILMIGCMVSFVANAQQKQVRQGNKLYEEKKYKEASAAYQQALQKNPSYTPGLFNLGNSLYQQKQYDAARKVMDATAKTAKDKNGKGAVNYNIGNTYMQEQKWQEAIDAYKQALRNNPQDAEAKYNLSYAQAMMKKDQNGGSGKDNKDQKDKNDKQDKNKDQQDKGDNKDQKDQQGDKDKEKQDQQGKDQQDKNEKGDDKEQQRPQPQPSKLSQQQADQLLNALQQEEKKLQQDKMKKENGMPVKVEKDW